MIGKPLLTGWYNDMGQVRVSLSGEPTLTIIDLRFLSGKGYLIFEISVATGSKSTEFEQERNPNIHSITKLHVSTVGQGFLLALSGISTDQQLIFTEWIVLKGSFAGDSSVIWAG